MLGMMEFLFINGWCCNLLFFLLALKKLINVIFLLCNVSYKQRGKLAESAYNVFFYISYEGTVDVDKILDPVSFKFSLSLDFFYTFD